MLTSSQKVNYLLTKSSSEKILTVTIDATSALNSIDVHVQHQYINWPKDYVRVRELYYWTTILL